MKSMSRRSRQLAQCKSRNWRAYNENLKCRGKITVWITQQAIRKWHDPEPSSRGAPRKYADIAIEVCLILRQVYRLPFRQTEGFVSSVLEMMELDIRPPCYTTICRRQHNLPVALSRRTRRSKNMVFLVDSTGLKVFGEGEWKVRQHGYTKRRTWQKIHLGIDSDTQQIQAAELTTNSVSDAEMVSQLLKQLPGKPKKFIGDGGYDQWKVYSALEKGKIEPVIPPKKNAKIKKHGNRSGARLPRDENIRVIRRVGRAKWKKQSQYHQRSKVETAMYRYKISFGDKLKARNFLNQITEVRIGCRILNEFLKL